MNLRLDAMTVDIDNVYLEMNEVHVHFEYEYFNENVMKLFLFSYVGESENDYRFCLKTIYMIDFENKRMNSEEEMIQECIEAIIPSLTELIMTIDSLLKEKRRH